MKKTFRSILSGALSLLAVSCYDDSAIQEQLRDHEDRLSSIEATLSAEVGGVNDLVSRIEALEGQIATKVDAKTVQAMIEEHSESVIEVVEF